MSDTFWNKWRVAAVVVLLGISWASTPPTGINYALGSVFGAVVMVWIIGSVVDYARGLRTDAAGEPTDS